MVFFWALFMMLAAPVLAADGAAPLAGTDAAAAVESTSLSSSSEESAGFCAEDPLVTQAGPLGCRYCDLEYCGCVPREECELHYSCSCSDIWCSRSCQYKNCTA